MVGLIPLVFLILSFNTLMPALTVLGQLQQLPITLLLNLPQKKNCVSSYSAPNSPTWPTNTNKVNTSEDPPTNNNATLSPDDEVLLSTVFPHHSLMVKHF